MDIRRKGEKQGDNGQANKGSGGSSGSGVFGTVLTIFVLVALAGFGYYYMDSGTNPLGGSGSSGGIDGPVATVNGQEIPGEQLETQLENFRNSTSTQAQQFKQLSETRQQEILLEGIINTELQIQAAEGAGITVSDSEVESELQSRVEQIGADEFERRLAENDVTRQEVRDDLRDQMLISAYIQQEAGGQITATDAEIQQLYQQYTTQIQQASGTTTGSVPALEQLRPQIEAAVIQQKQQQIASDLLAQARENAQIEVLLEGVSYPASTPGSANTSSPAPAPTETETSPAPTPEDTGGSTAQ